MSKRFGNLLVVAIISIFLNAFLGNGSMLYVLMFAEIAAMITIAFLSSKEEKEKNEVFNLLDENFKAATKLVRNIQLSLDSIGDSVSIGAEKMQEIDSSVESTGGKVISSKETTRQAKQLTDEAMNSAIHGTAEMEEMMTSISEIKRLSDEIGNIIKVINDIAFQTNILALNAAVEAARAGEAGKGFAVVAEEVRNLAQKSAEAAKNTEEIIEKNIKSAENGVKASSRVNGALVEINTQIGKVGELINEITASSEEQADGVGFIGKAVNSMEAIFNKANDSKKSSATTSTELNKIIVSLNGCIEVIKGSKTIDEIEVVKKEEIKEEIKEVKTTSSTTVRPSIAVKPAARVEVAKPRPVVKTVKKEVEEPVKAPSSDPAELAAALGLNSPSVEPEVKLKKSDAEMILPLDDTDGF